MAKRLITKAGLDRITPKQLKAVARSHLSPRLLLGKWENCDRRTRGVVRVVLGRSGSVFTVQLFGARTPTPCDWGVMRGVVYSESVSSAVGIAFTAHYKFSFKEVVVTGHLDQGCLTLEHYNRFTDGSGRCDYYMKERFCRH